MSANAFLTGPRDPGAFAAALRWRRKRAGLSQVQLAAQVGYHHSVVSRWESGSRVPPPSCVAVLDELLEADGELVGLATRSRARRPTVPTDPRVPRRRTPPPVPTYEGMAPSRDAIASAWPARLPHGWTACPLHGWQGCSPPPPAEALRLYADLSRAATPRPDEDTVHVLAAQLTAYARLSSAAALPALTGATEAALQLINRLERPDDEVQRRALRHLAGAFAGLSGRLRLLRGQHGAAMQWYPRGLHWAALAGATPLRVALLCDLSTLARLEQDPVSALAHARSVAAVGEGQPWALVLSHLSQARAHAMTGAHLDTTRSIAAVRSALEGLGRRDEESAPWLSGPAGEALVQAGVGAALRDVAVATGDAASGRAAIDATELALAATAPGWHVERVLVGLRLADCHAAAGDPDHAMALARPLLPDAAGLPVATVVHELRGLQQRLADGWPSHPGVEEILQRCP